MKLKIKTKNKSTMDIVRVPKGQKDEVRKTKAKKREVEDEEEPVAKVKKKKKKTSTELVVIDGAPPLPRKIKKSELKAHFGRHAQTIVDMLEMNDNDGALTLLKKKLLQSTISLVPFAEQAVRDTKSQRGIYQFTALVNQVRELITDIRADEDRRYIAQSLIDHVLRPAFMEIAQNIITDHHGLRGTTERFIKSEHSQAFNAELQKLAKGLATKMMEVYKDVEVKTHDQLKN